MSEESLYSANTYTINTLEDMDKLLERNAPVMLIPSTFNIEYYYKGKSKEKVKYDSYRRMAFPERNCRTLYSDCLYYPFGYAQAAFSESNTLARLVNSISSTNENGLRTILMFSISPKNLNHLSFCADLIDYCYLQEKNKLGWTVNSHIETYLQRIVTNVPYPFCYIMHKKGEFLKYKYHGEVISWSTYWDIPPNKLQVPLKEYIEKTHPALWREYKDRHNNLRVIEENMRAGLNAGKGFKKYPDNLLLLDAFNCKPISFAIKTGNSAIVVFPDCVDVEAFVAEINNGQADTRGFEIIKSYLANRKNPFDLSIPIKFPIASKAVTPVKFTIKFTGHSGFKAVNDKYPIITSAQKFEIERWDSMTSKTETDKISAKTMLKFLSIWLASRNGSGVCYYDGDDEEQPDRNVCYRDTRGRMQELPGKELFSSSSNMGTEIIEETIMRVLCGSDSNENRELRGKEINSMRTLDDKGHLRKDTIYKVERINPESVKIVIEGNVRKLLGKITVKGTSFDSDNFKKKLIDAVNSQPSA